MDIYAILRTNLAALMAAAKDKKRKGPWSKLQLEADSGVGKSTIYRIFDHDEREDVGLSKLQSLAEAFKLPAWSLLQEGLDPVAKPIATTQAALDAKIEEAAQQLLEDVLDERRAKKPRLIDPEIASLLLLAKLRRRARLPLDLPSVQRQPVRRKTKPR